MGDGGIKRGQQWRDARGVARIVTVVDGYVVARRGDATPFAVERRAFRDRFSRVDGNAERAQRRRLDAGVRRHFKRISDKMLAA